MNDDNPHSSNGSSQKGWFERMVHSFKGEPQNKEELSDLISDAEQRELIDPQTKEMIEGVMEVSEMRVRDIMIPRAQMITLDVEKSIEDLVPTMIESAHSRFPVISEDKDHIEGILLAKDLLFYAFNKTGKMTVRSLLREAIIVPESKRVDALLKEFRQQRYHMAIVVDEYGGVSGLVTIEDILELIVGEIEDEYDDEPPESDNIRPLNKYTYSVKALTPVDDFNEFFETEFNEEESDTIGGVVLRAFGHMPNTGEQVSVGNIAFEVTNSDKRRLLQLKVHLPGDETQQD